MKLIFSIGVLFCISTDSPAQSGFRTVVPREPVIAGESFQVQYILEDAAETDHLTPPVFTGFRMVSGPAIYHGSVVTVNGLRPLKNEVYTLQALRPGKFLIRGATITKGKQLIKSNDVEIVVITGEEAGGWKERESNTDYILRPGEDVYKKIRDNLFMKVQVNRKTCYVGEPILATFTLYSRLESRSDIIKNPGFYGFTVYDIINLSDRQVSSKVIGGKNFDVHTVRKVQLYPLQAGTLLIDAMEVRNRVEFSRSVINKKAEQEIVEGMMGFPEEELPSEGTEVYESEMHTEPVSIQVKALPPPGKPLTYNGAVGKFTLQASLGNESIGKNSEGLFIISIRGEGNFIQIDAPKPTWPAGMEVFEPRVSDVLDKSSYPLKGERSFSYPFVVSRSGEFLIPPVSLHFFDPDSGFYRTVTTAATRFNVNEKAGPGILPVLRYRPASGKNRMLIWAGVILGLLSITYYAWHKKLLIRRSPAPAAVDIQESLADKLLHPTLGQLESGSNEFYRSLQQAIWKFFSEKAGLSGSGINKRTLSAALRVQEADPALITELGQILEACESGMFTNASLQYDKKILLERTREILKELEGLF